MASSSRDIASPRPAHGHKRRAASMSGRALTPSSQGVQLHHVSERHRHTKSDSIMTSSPSSSSPSNPDSPCSARAASRIMTSVRRSLSVSPGSFQKKRQPSISQSSGMYSTPEEQFLHAPSRLGSHHPSSAPPTIEQIAMGLHISRTPHLRPISSQQAYPLRNPTQVSLQHPYKTNPYATSRRATSTIILPPPPERSSLKKPSTVTSTATSANLGLSTTSASSTTVTSSDPSTPLSNRSLSSLKLRMTRFLPGSRSSSAPSSKVSSPMSSPRESTTDIMAPRKAVRFSAPGLGVEEEG